MSKLATLIAVIALMSPSALLAADAPSMAGPINATATAPGAPKPGSAPMDDLAIPSPLGDMALGEPEAPVTVVEYASMTCPHCAAFARFGAPKLRGYVDAGKVRWVFREFPLDIKAVAAAILARCMAHGDAAKFFGVVDGLFAAQDKWMRAGNTADEFRAVARGGGLDEKGFEACFNDQDTVAGIKRIQDIASTRLKVDGTPTFFVNGVRVKSDDWSLLEKAIGEALRERP